VKRFIYLALALAACAERDDPSMPRLSRAPVSVRGWIVDVEGAQPADRTPETEAARRAYLFQNTTVWVENAAFVSGGVAENGAFILLDVPPGNVTVSFTAPGAEGARLVLQNIPGNADVFVPNLLLKKNGVALLDPNGVKVRIAADVPGPLPTEQTAIVATKPVYVVQVPLTHLADRRDYPNPGGIRPVATFK
jgi:hypothetical protein